jgi:hypothetical protein
MNTTTILCPKCGAEIALGDALTEQFRHDNEARLAAFADEAKQRARADIALERRLLEAQLAEEREKRAAAQKAELALRREKSALAERARELDLEVARRLDAERERLAETLRNGFAAQHDLKLKERDKLKADQRALGANLAVIVSTALPDGIVEFGRLDGVWVAGLRAWPALATALREQLVAVAFAHAAAEGKQEKMELLYRYLAGDQFKSRIMATVEAFTALQAGLNRERTAMERLWKEREKQIERVLANTAGLYGEMRGLVGASLPALPALELAPIAGALADMTAERVP